MHLALLLAVLQPGTAPRHHGFFFRADLGLGYYASSPGETTFSGAGGGLGLSIGAGVAENFALFVSLFDAAVANARVSVGSASADTDVSSSVGGLGIGFTYYFMPANVFISGTGGAGQATADQLGRSHPSRIGPIVRLGVGKEWFVSNSWGLGVAGYLTWSHNAIQDYPQSPWTTVAPLLAFSATFY